MENNRRGIFYGVIGVATLVVAIIGATFAFFSASASSTNNAITAQSTEVEDFEIINEVTVGLRTDLIPVSSSDVNFARYIGIEADQTGINNTCEDNQGNDICSVFKFTVFNPGSTAQPAYFFLKGNVNTFTNLRYAVFKVGNPTGMNATTMVSSTPNTFSQTPTWNLLASSTNEVNGGLTINGTNKSYLVIGPSDNLKNGNTNEFSLGGLNHTMAAKEVATYAIVLWIEETDSDQTEADSKKSFAGTVRIATSSDGRSGVTAVLSS